MPCPACEALPGQPSSVSPHAFLVYIGSESSNYGIAGTDGGENYRCSSCGSYLYRHTGRLDTRVWSWAASPEEEAASVAKPVLYLVEDVRLILEPYGFEVREGSLPWGTFPCAWKELSVTSNAPDWKGGPDREYPIFVRIHFPSGISPEEIELGVSGSPNRDFSGQVFIIHDLEHLRKAAPIIAPYFEENVGSFLCPKCRGLMEEKTNRSTGQRFMGCQHYRNPHRNCNWTGRLSPKQPWPRG